MTAGTVALALVIVCGVVAAVTALEDWMQRREDRRDEEDGW